MTIVNPFARYSGNTLWAAGIFVTIVGSAIAYAGQARYDGVLDVHFSEVTEFYRPLLDNMLNTGCLALFLFATGRYINGKTRLADIVPVVLLSRLPLYMLSLFGMDATFNAAIQDIRSGDSIAFSPELSGIGLLLLIAVCGMAALIAVVVILRYGFAVACRARTVKHWVLFAGAVLCSELVSKLLFYVL